MSVAKFDTQQHHIGLGPIRPEDSTSGVAELYGFLLNPGYLRRGQNWTSPAAFGGERNLLSAPSLSRWTQDDFSGGVGQYVWGDDAAMVARTFNMIPLVGKRSVRTAPPLYPWRTENIGGRTPLYTFAYGGSLYVVCSDRVRCVRISDGHRWDIDPSQGLGGDIIEGAYFDRRIGRLILGVYRDLLQESDVDAYHVGVDNGIKDTSLVLGNPMAQAWGKNILGLGSDGRGGYLVAYGNDVYRVKAKDNTNQTGEWTKIDGRLQGAWRGSVPYNGMVYILTGDLAVNRGAVVAFDGTNLLPVCEFPYNFSPKCIESYAGRLYVGGSGKDIGDAEKYAELYEITGSSLRLLKGFGTDARTPGVMKPKAFNSLHVHEGLLWMFERGVGLIAYDVTTDAFYGGPSFQTFDNQRESFGFASTGEVLYTYIRHPLDANGDGWHRVTTINDSLALGYDGVVITSAFGPEPARRKRWSEIVLLSRFGSPTVEYRTDAASSDNGWFGDLPTNVVQKGDYFWTTVDLRGLPPSEQVSFRIKLHKGVDVVNWAELVGFTVGFVFLDTGKWTWSFTINGSLRVEGPEGNGISQDVHDIGTELRRYWRERIPLQFRDLTGDTHQVQLIDFQESQPIIAASVGFTDPTNLESTIAQEAFYTVQLVEV